MTVAEIRCRFPSDSQKIRHLGEYLKNVTTSKFTPRFIIGEKDSKAEPQEIRITLSVIDVMMHNASFKLEAAQIPVSNEYAVTTVTLSVAAGEALPISGFPRTLIAKKVTKGILPTHLVAATDTKARELVIVGLDKGGTQKQPKLPPRVVGHLSWRDDTSSEKSESSVTAFPEIQQLPKEAKWPIQRFLQERIAALYERGEKVPVKLRLLEEASEEMDYEGYNPEEGGPYGTVLHTASAIGNRWIVEMQIKAGVDVTALDHHGWTAFMVADAQGHTACARLLFQHMEAIGVGFVADAIAPSGIVKSEPSSPIEVESDDLMAMPGSWHYSLIRKRVQVRANHPIPPSYSTFYFEVAILNNGPLGYVKLLVISSLVTEK